MRPDWPDPFLTMPTQKNFDPLLIFMNLYEHAKKPGLFHLTMPTQKNFGPLLIFMNLYEHTKNPGLFHLLIVELQSILESSHQTGHTHF